MVSNLLDWFLSFLSRPVGCSLLSLQVNQVERGSWRVNQVERRLYFHEAPVHQILVNQFLACKAVPGSAMYSISSWQHNVLNLQINFLQGFVWLKGVQGEASLGNKCGTLLSTFGYHIGTYTLGCQRILPFSKAHVVSQITITDIVTFSRQELSRESLVRPRPENLRTRYGR